MEQDRTRRKDYIMETKQGLTTDQAIEQELYSLGEALGNCLELTDDFLESSCGFEVRELLELVDESDREYALQGSIGEGSDGGYCSPGSNEIAFPVGEIEVQFEGEPEKYFEDPDEWTINGDLAYLTMVSACFRINLDTLRDAVSDLLCSKYSNLEGTVSHGTMRPEDLIPVFADTLERLARQAAPHPGAINPDHLEIISEARELSEEDYNSEDPDTMERISWILNEDLFPALDSFSPPGFYFGSHPGDGSDYGFWISL